MEKTIKADRYLRIYGQLCKLISKTLDPIARMATICAVLHHKFDYYYWTGFYRLLNDELIVVCYQGPLACLVLTAHTGVCWASIDEQQIQIVPDVNQFPDYIACDTRSLSEITVPVYDRKEQIAAVFDIDSRQLSAFDEIDAEWLEKIVTLIYEKD